MQFGRGPYETSAVRDHLINSIFNEAFSQKEKGFIVENDNISDIIFILSAQELSKYGIGNLPCSHTSYAGQCGIRI